MRSSRLRTAVVIAVAAIVGGGLVAPTVASATTAEPTSLLPNDASSAPDSAVPATTLRHNVVLTWAPVSGATSYDVQVTNGDTSGGDGGSFVSPSVGETTTLPQLALPPSLPHGDYAWHVRVSGTYAWSTTAYFTRGWDAAPGNPHMVSPHGPVVTWDALPDASYYEVQFSDEPFVQGSVTDGGSYNTPENTFSCYTTATMFSPGDMVDGTLPANLGKQGTDCTEIFWLNILSTTSGPLYWRVRGRDGVLDSADDVVNTDPPALSCAGVWYYRTPATTEDTPECSDWAYPPQDAQDNTFTEIVATQQAAAPPTNPEITPVLDPTVSPVTLTNSPAFTWTAPTDGNNSFYRIDVSRTPDMSTLDYVWEVTSDAYAPEAQLPYHSTRYYWTVQSCAVETPAGGSILGASASWCSAPTTPQAFISAPQATVVSNATTNAVKGGTTFSWSTALDATKPDGTTDTALQVASPEAMGYELQISDAYGSFTKPSLDENVDRQGEVGGQSSVTLPTASLLSGYRWRVRAVDQSLNDYPWSAERQVGTLKTSNGTITTKKAFGLTSSLTIGFDAPVDGASSSTVRIVPTDATKSPVAGTLTQSGATTYTFKPTKPWTAGEYYGLSLTSGVTASANGVPATASIDTVRASTTVDSASPAVTKHTGDYAWTTEYGSDAKGGSYLKSDDRSSTSARSYLDIRVRGTSATIYTCMGPTSGNARLYVDGSAVATISLYKSYNACGKLTTIHFSSSTAHTIRFAPTGTKSSKSSGTSVRFDELTVT